MRDDAGVRQADVARVAGVSPSLLSKSRPGSAGPRSRRTRGSRRPWALTSRPACTPRPGRGSATATRSDGRGRDLLAPPALGGHARGGRPEPGARLDRPRAPRPGRAAGGGGRARVRAAQAGAADPLERPEGRRDRGGLAAAGVRWTRHNREWQQRRGGCCARPTRPTRATRSRRSPAPRQWPGPALVWARIDRGRAELVA